RTAREVCAGKVDHTGRLRVDGRLQLPALRPMDRADLDQPRASLANRVVVAVALATVDDRRALTPLHMGKAGDGGRFVAGAAGGRGERAPGRRAAGDIAGRVPGQPGDARATPRL